MIENMRKYTALMIIVFVLLIAGFLFTMGPASGSGAGGGSGPAVLEVYGLSIDEQEYYRRGDRTLQLSSELGLHFYVNFLIAPDIQQLMQANQLMRYGYANYYVTMSRNLDQQDFNRFITNRATLQRAMSEMGLYASEEEVTQSLKTSQRFAPNGQYNALDYTAFVDNRLGRLGMTEKYLREIVRESICLNKLIQLVGGGLSAPRTAVQDQQEARNQSITLARITLDRDDFVEKENPSEEEIKAYWEVHQDAYKTREQRRISYILLDQPETPKQEDKKTNSEEKPATETAKNDTENDAEKNRKEAEEKAKKAAEEKKKAARIAVMRDVEAISDKIVQKINDKLPLDFEAISAEYNQTLVKSDLFTQDSPPAALKDLSLRGNSARGRNILDEVFSMAMTSDPYDLVSKPFRVGETGWIIFRLDEIIEPVLLDYTAARAKARAQLISENATKKVKNAADEARVKILASMKSGKGFDVAAKELGFTSVQIGPYSVDGIAPKNEPSYRQLHQTASGLNIGDVSEAIHEKGRSLIIFVENREIEDTEQNKNMVDSMVDSSKGELAVRSFMNWRDSQFQKAKVSGTFAQNN
ncbi:MAG: SurA N-terminal domain-containing protein [Akkermansiaceae bacterium]|nr:SurA N-terminal domain-containing protein [Akkermansiaceae bacterium]